MRNKEAKVSHQNRQGRVKGKTCSLVRRAEKHQKTRVSSTPVKVTTMTITWKRKNSQRKGAKNYTLQCVIRNTVRHWDLSGEVYTTLELTLNYIKANTGPASIPGHVCTHPTASIWGPRKKRWLSPFTDRNWFMLWNWRRIDEKWIKVREGHVWQ